VLKALVSLSDTVGGDSLCGQGPNDVSHFSFSSLMLRERHLDRYAYFHGKVEKV
jgi:hypothetical protein